MDRVEDRLNGKRIAVVYGSPQLPIPSGAKRFAAATQVRRFAKANHAKHVLRTADAKGMRTWWAGAAGVSLAAAVDEWAESAAEAGADDAVVVPLDARVYCARLAEGLVEEEAMLAGERLAEKLEEWEREGVNIHAFEGGSQGELLGGRLGLEGLPFEPTAHRFGGIVREFARRGMFHPAFVAAAVVLIALPALGMAYFEWGARAAESVARELHEMQAAADALQADFSGAAKVERFAAMVSGEATLPLLRDGLAIATYDATNHLATLRGERAYGYPAAAEAYAKAAAGEFHLVGGQWEILVGVGVAPDFRTVDGRGHGAVVAAVYAAGMAAGGAVALGVRSERDETVETGMVVTLSEVTTHDLAILADSLAGRPVALLEGRCQFDGWLIRECTFALSAKGVDV